MGSSGQQDRSLTGGISLPQWMKGKTDNRFDFDESAFSPPSQDDSFFYLRYPKKQTRKEQGKFTQEICKTENALKNTEDVQLNVDRQRQLVSEFNNQKEQTKQLDFSKHPLPCQPFIPNATKVNEPKQPKTIIAGNTKAKSQGTDDGFHGEPALCGKSIVHVATQIMSSKLKNISSTVTPASPTENRTVAQQMVEQGLPRKGSKSLPATPIASPMTSPDSSPKARRKVYSNRYFTGPFLPDKEKYQGGWILSSILGQSREVISAKIDEEDESGFELAPPKALSRKKSISSQNLTYIGKEESIGEKKSQVNGKSFQAKPAELREMNFWSPTSM